METHSGARFFITSIALLLIGILIGVFADPYLPASFSNSGKGYQAGFAAAKQRVEESSIGNLLRASEDLRSLSGTVTSVAGNRLSLHLSFANPFDDQVLDDRTVLVGTGTKVVKLSIVPTKETLPIRQTTETVVDASAIKVGDVLSVMTAENVKILKEFTASEIKIQPVPEK